MSTARESDRSMGSVGNVSPQHCGDHCGCIGNMPGIDFDGPSVGGDGDFDVRASSTQPRSQGLGQRYTDTARAHGDAQHIPPTAQTSFAAVPTDQLDRALQLTLIAQPVGQRDQLSRLVTAVDTNHYIHNFIIAKVATTMGRLWLLPSRHVRFSQRSNIVVCGYRPGENRLDEMSHIARKVPLLSRCAWCAAAAASDGFRRRYSAWLGVHITRRSSNRADRQALDRRPYAGPVISSPICSHLDVSGRRSAVPPP